MSIATMPELSQESVGPDFEEIYRQYSSMVYRTARAVTGSAEDAEDVLQTIFLRLIRSEYSGQLRKNPRAYLYRASVNLSLDLLRARSRRTFTHEVERLETPASPSKARFDDDLHRRLSVALAELSPEAAHILVLRYVHDYSDAEISKLLGTSRGAIAVRLFRLRARLKKSLGRLGEAHDRR
jgi:RNA polymerase sigma-70 factor (ECF subfamily)